MLSFMLVEICRRSLMFLGVKKFIWMRGIQMDCNVLLYGKIWSLKAEVLKISKRNACFGIKFRIRKDLNWHKNIRSNCNVNCEKIGPRLLNKIRKLLFRKVFLASWGAFLKEGKDRLMFVDVQDYKVAIAVESILKQCMDVRG